MVNNEAVFSILKNAFPVENFFGVDFFYTRVDFSGYEGNVLRRELGGVLWVDLCGGEGRSVFKKLFGVGKKFPFLTSVGFVYYLPAFIMYMLEEKDYDFLQFCLFNLYPRDDVSSFDRVGEIYSYLNDEQIKAVKISLLEICERWVEWGVDENDAKIALQEYWNFV